MESTATSPKNVFTKFIIPIVGLIVLIVIIFYIYKWYQNKKKQEPLVISDPISTGNIQPIDGTTVPLSTNGVEYTYSFWMFVRDWSRGLGAPKCVMYRSNASGYNYEVASPSIWLYPNENKLMIRVSTYPGTNYDSASYPSYPMNSENLPIVNPNKWKQMGDDVFAKLANNQYVCDVSNIPLQKWVNVTVSMWNRTMDVYINGKLVRSCILPGVPVNDSTHLSTLYIGGASGANTFNGYVSRFKYLNRATTPNEIMKMYLAGPYGSNYWFKNMKTKLNITLDMTNGSN